MQALGRTHRTNQASAPIYELLFTDLGGEKRFASSVARRMQSLGALTQGASKGAGMAAELAAYNFEKDEGEKAAKAFVAALENIPKLPGTEISGFVALREMGLLRKDNHGNETVGKLPPGVGATKRVMNRILNLTTHTQRAAFSLFMELFQEAQRQAEARGTLPVKISP